MSKFAGFLNLLLTFDGAIAGIAAAVAQVQPAWSTGCHAVIVGSASVGAILAGVSKATGNASPPGAGGTP